MLERIRSRVARAERWAQWRFRPAPKSNNSYTGVFETIAEATASLGPRAPAGFDSDTGASLYSERLDRVFPEDYPVLFWLRPEAAALRKVFDFGGHVGLHFYGLRQKLDLPEGAEWVVSDLPAVMTEGERLAKQRGVKGLRFEGGFEGGDGADLFISSGALQYLEHDALAQALGRYAQRPKHVVLNKMPVIDGPAFFTVQDTWMLKVPYAVFNREQLVGGLERLGYRLIDSWGNPGHHCMVWRQPERSVPEFTGYYFRLG